MTATVGSNGHVRELPHDSMAERSVIATLLRCPGSFPDVGELRAADFYDVKLARVFRACEKAQSDSGQHDIVVVRNVLAKGGHLDEVGGDAELTALWTDAFVSSNAQWHAQIVRELAVERRAILVGHATEARLHAGENVGDVLADAQEQLRKVVGADAPDTAYRPVVEFLRPYQLAELPPRRWLWADVIAQGDLVDLFGPWGTCKSFLALGLAVALADGVQFLGHDVAQGLGLIVCGEGGAGQANRLRAATSVSRVADRTDPLHSRLGVACGMPALTTAAGFDGTVRAIEAMGTPPALLVVDTWARACAATGVDENSTGESGQLVAACDRLRARFPGMALLAVHHSGNTNTDRSRGSSVLPSSSDVILRVDTVRAPGLPQVRVVFDKVKDGRKPRPLLVSFAESVVGTDERGKLVTSLRVDSFYEDAAERDGGSKEPKTTTAERLLRALNEAGDEGLSFAQGKDATTKKDATVSEGFAKLVADGIAEPFTVDGKKRWRLRSGGAA